MLQFVIVMDFFIIQGKQKKLLMIIRLELVGFLVGTKTKYVYKWYSMLILMLQHGSTHEMLRNTKVPD